jgi:hypothetical protein
MNFGLNSPESKLLGQVSNRLFAKVQKIGLNKLTPAERAFHVVYCVSIALESEVIYAIFHQTPELLPYAVDAYFDVGLPGDSANFVAMLQLLPKPARKDEARLAQVMAIQEEDPDLDDKIQELNGEFDRDRVDEALYHYLHQHRAELLPDW